MDLKKVLTKVEKLQAKHKAEQLKLAKKARAEAKKTRGNNRQWALGRAARHEFEANRPATSLKFYKRLGIFKNAQNTVGFDPLTMEGHSYNWYSLVKQVKGTVLLNMYSYSNQTIKHAYSMSSLLKDLGIKFKTLEAPNGLQNLEISLQHHLFMQAKLELGQLHARKSNSWIKKIIKGHAKSVELLKSLGVKASKDKVKQAKESAQKERDHKLAHSRAKSAERRALAKISIVYDLENQQMSAVGFHTFQPYCHGSLGDYTADRLKHEALIKGFSTIIVHIKEDAHLKLVSG